MHLAACFCPPPWQKRKGAFIYFIYREIFLFNDNSSWAHSSTRTGINKQGGLGDPTEPHTSKTRRMDTIREPHGIWEAKAQNGRAEKLRLERLVPERYFCKVCKASFECLRFSVNQSKHTIQHLKAIELFIKYILSLSLFRAAKVI